MELMSSKTALTSESFAATTCASESRSSETSRTTCLRMHAVSVSTTPASTKTMYFIIYRD